MELGHFERDVWRVKRMLSAADNKTEAYIEAVHDIVNMIPLGLDRASAVDVCIDMALAYDLDATDVLQVELERIGDVVLPEVHIPDGRANGNGIAHAPPAPRLQFLSVAEFVRGFVPPDYLVEGLLQRGFVYALTGPTGHAKSAIALLLAELVGARGPQFFGPHRVEHGRVVYFVGENPADIRMRVIGAHSQRNDDPLSDEIVFIPGIFDIAKLYETLVRELARGGDVSLVIVDTSAAYFLGNEELSNTQMGAHARMLRRLTELPGKPCVLVLCHPVKYVADPSQLLPRGGGAFVAEVDANLTCSKHDDVLVALHHNKIRGPGFEPLTFKLETIRTDKLVDAKGRKIPTVRAVWCSQSDEDAQASNVFSDDEHALAARLFFGDDEPPSVADLAKHLGWTSDEGVPSKSRVHRALERLEKAKPSALVYRDRSRWYLTEKGKDAARKASLKMAAVERSTATNGDEF